MKMQIAGAKTDKDQPTNRPGSATCTIIFICLSNPMLVFGLGLTNQDPWKKTLCLNSAGINKLASEGTFEGDPLHGRVIETHISWVVLSETFAFKIKKPIRLDFLDFSTLALRKKYCRRELLLNKNWSNIYRKVCPIRLVNDRFVIDGSNGRVVDYAVIMRRLEDENKMDVLLANGRVSISDVVKLAILLTNIHSRAKIVRRPFSLRYSRDLFNEIKNFINVALQSGGHELEETIHRSVEWSDAFLAHHAKRFQERIGLGFQRDVHGDLHSGNIFLEEKPVIFDCIEFNDRYRQIDILYEIAFLAMDLEAYRHPRLAAALIRQYAKRMKCMETAEDRMILDYFKCLRANVRAKIHFIQVANSSDASSARRHATEARKYVLLMKKYISNH